MIYGASYVLPQHQRTAFSSLDANGNPGVKEVVSYGDTTDTTTETNGYNYLNQLITRDVSGTAPYHVDLSYDDNGSLTTENYNDNRPTDSLYTYSPDQQLVWSLSETKHDTSNYNSYNRTEKSYVYQFSGQLLKEISKVNDTTNIYAPVTDNFTDYFYYSHDGAVAERHDDIGVTKYFTRLGGELLACDNNGQSYFYIQNIRGDVMALVGVDGVVKSVRDYDASGQMLCKSPGHTDRDPFGFTGGLDAGNGMWKLGARFYDSSKDSFIQQDRYMGDPSDPLSLNRYVYCGLDPVNNVDPTGFFAMAIPLIIIAEISCPPLLIGTIAAAAVGVTAAIIMNAARDKMHPDPLAGDAPHSVYQRNGTTGKIKKYETYGPQTDPRNKTKTVTVKRYDGPGGDPHLNEETGEYVDTPHVHDPNTPGGVRPANPDEIPK